MTLLNKPEDNGSDTRVPANGNDAAPKLSVLQRMKQKNQEQKPEVMSVERWLDLCSKTSDGKTLPAYADFADRLLNAIGEPQIVDTRVSEDPRERHVYGAQKIARYKPFSQFYDAEAIVTKTVEYLKNGGSGMLVYRGPVGSGKTEVATTMERLTEVNPIYVLKCKKTGKISPYNDSPLCLFTAPDVADDISAEYKIPRRYLQVQMSSWVAKRLEHAGHDIEAAFEVAKVYPSRNSQLGISKIDPQDPKSANLGLLIGEVDITMVGEEDPLDSDKVMSSGDPDAYIPGAFAKSNQGLFHGAEFFRNNPALLNCFLEGVTTGYYTGDKGVGNLPMDQCIVITTNDPVWQDFVKKNDSDAARNRITLIDVPYTLRISEEMKIYQKLLQKSRHSDAPIADKTLETLAEFSVLTRMKDGKDGALKNYDKHIRARVWNGEDVDAPAGKKPTLNELRQKQSPGEGMDGFSIRDAERVLKDSFNARAMEGYHESDPLLMLETMEKFIKAADESTFSSQQKGEFQTHINGIRDRYMAHARELINRAMTDADDGVCQVQFDKYLFLAEKWNEREDFIDPKSGDRTDLAKIAKILESMEKKAGISNPESFRKTATEGVNAELARIAKKNRGKPLEEQEDAVVRWDSYEPLAKVIRANNAVDQETRRHIFKAKAEADLNTDEEKRQYSRFNDNMEKAGFTPSMTARHLHHLNMN
ncbi:MAG: hypothetical protein JWO78_1341 [Micavibrio sp.]|nr:hypothetical protein [Micavibrio sp.]